MRQSILKAIYEQARIEQIPEMLIENMQEIIRSFQQNKAAPAPEIEHPEATDATKPEITISQRLKERRKTQNSWFKAVLTLPYLSCPYFTKDNGL